MAGQGTAGTQQSGAGTIVGPGSVRVLDKKDDRLFATIQNDSVNNVYITFGKVAALNAGIKLNPNGGSIWIGRATDMPYTGIVSAIAVAPSNVITTDVGP